MNCSGPGCGEDGGACETPFPVASAVLAGAPALLVALLLGWIGARRAFLTKQRQMEEVDYHRQLAKIERALDEHRKDGGRHGLQHPMALINANDFLDNGRLETFETVQRKGKLVLLSTMSELAKFEQTQRIIFFSHQWTGWRSPDATGEQYETMVAALNHITREKGWDKSHVFIWVDYTSVPQRNRPTQELAISSLSVYSARSHIFCAIGNMSGLPYAVMNERYCKRR